MVGEAAPDPIVLPVSYSWGMNRKLCFFALFAIFALVLVPQASAASFSKPDFSGLDYSPVDPGQNSMLKLIYIKAPLVGQEIFKAVSIILMGMLPWLLRLEWGWLCLRVIRGSWLGDELILFITKLFLIWLFLYNQMPLKLLIDARKDFIAGGRAMANQIFYSVESNAEADWKLQRGKDVEPYDWWRGWVQRDTTRSTFGFSSNATVDQGTPLFNMGVIMNRVYGMQTSDVKSSVPKSDDAAYQDTLSAILRNSTPSAGAIAAGTSFFGSIGQIIANLININMMASFIVFSFQVLAVGVLGLADFAFWILLSLGICTVPLLIFNLYGKIWINYIHALMATILAPATFYIFAAVSLIFANALYEGMFPIQSGESKTSAQLMMSGVFKNLTNEKTISSAIKQVSGQESPDPPAWYNFWQGNPVTQFIAPLEHMMIYLGIWQAFFVGCMLTLSFASLGSLIATGGSLAAAYSWNRAFEDIYLRVFGALEGGIMSIANQVSSGAASVAGAALGRAGQIGMGASRILRGGGGE